MEIEIGKIFIKPERQRKDLGDLEGLKTSILNVGLINPLIVEEREEEPGTYWLIAGERRYTACKELGKEKLEVREFCSLDEISRQLIELEENVKRKDLTWQENVAAVMKIWELKDFETAEELAKYLGCSTSQITRMKSAWDMRDNEKVWGADNLSSAYTVCKRESARIFGSATSDLGFLIQNFCGDQDGQGTEKGTERELAEGLDEGNKQVDRSGREATQSTRENSSSTDRGISEKPAGESRLLPQYEIIQGDFLTWAENYEGLPFNLLHLDFPYGINHDRSQQGNTKNFGTYTDTEDLYKTLVRALLENQDRLVSSSAHCICWLSLRFEAWTREMFEKAGWGCSLQPFIWYKSDNKGIIADTMCGMRNVGEYALLFNRSRRPVLKNISNIFPHPTTKTFHASEKPLGVLEYLFSALCDEHSRVLDPTCGSGTAIQTAVKCGAESALGIELDEEFAEKAKTWLKNMKQDFQGRNLEIDIKL